MVVAGTKYLIFAHHGREDMAAGNGWSCCTHTQKAERYKWQYSTHFLLFIHFRTLVHGMASGFPGVQRHPHPKVWLRKIQKQVLIPEHCVWSLESNKGLSPDPYSSRSLKSWRYLPLRTSYLN